jgi:hypothetical protein
MTEKLGFFRASLAENEPLISSKKPNFLVRSWANDLGFILTA